MQIARSLLLLLLLCVTCAFSTPALAQTSARETKRIVEGKITKNQAQHLVLQRYPGATINSCELRPAGKRSVWVVDLVKSGSHKSTTVEVDGRTGKMLTPDTQAASGR